MSSDAIACQNNIWFCIVEYAIIAYLIVIVKYNDMGFRIFG